MAMDQKEKRTVYFTMVLHPLTGWTRVGNAYSSRKAARGWLGFVRGRWHLPTRVAACTLTLVDRRPDARSLSVLDKKFNLDPPANNRWFERSDLLSERA